MSLTGVPGRPVARCYVRYVRWELTPAQVATFDAGPAVLVADHAPYAAENVLAAGTVAELARDLRQGG